MAERLPAGGAAGTSRAGGQDSAFTIGHHSQRRWGAQGFWFIFQLTDLNRKPLDATRAVNSEPANSPQDQKKPFPEKSGPSIPCLEGLPMDKLQCPSPYPRALAPAPHPRASGPWRSHTMPDPWHRGPRDPSPALGVAAPDLPGGLTPASAEQPAGRPAHIGFPGRALLRYWGSKPKHGSSLKKPKSQSWKRTEPLWLNIKH